MKASPVTVTRPDGEVQVLPAHGPSELRRIVLPQRAVGGWRAVGYQGRDRRVDDDPHALTEPLDSLHRHRS